MIRDDRYYDIERMKIEDGMYDTTSKFYNAQDSYRGIDKNYFGNELDNYEIEKVNNGLYDSKSSYYNKLEDLYGLNNKSSYSNSWNNNYDSNYNYNDYLNQLVGEENNEWDDNYNTKKNINSTTKNIEQGGEEVQKPENLQNKKGSFRQLLDMAGILGVIENTVSPIVGQGVKDDSLSLVPFHGAYKNVKNLLESDDKGEYLKDLYSDKFNSVTDGIKSGLNTIARGLDFTDNGEYDKNIQGIGETIDDVEEYAIANNQQGKKFGADLLEKHINPLYYGSKALAGSDNVVSNLLGIDQMTDENQQEEFARSIGNLGADISIGMLTGGVTDIANVGKGIKYLNNIDDIKKAENIVNNVDKATELAKKTNSIDDYIKYMNKADSGFSDTGDTISKMEQQLADMSKVDNPDVDKMNILKETLESMKKNYDDTVKSGYENFIKDTASATQKRAGDMAGSMPEFDGVGLGGFKVTREMLDNISKNKIAKGLTNTGLSILSPVGALLELGRKGINVLDNSTGGKINDIATAIKKDFGGTKWANQINDIKKDPNLALESANNINKMNMEQAYRDEKIHQGFNFGKELAKNVKDKGKFTEVAESGQYKKVTDENLYNAGDEVIDYDYNKSVANKINRDSENIPVKNFKSKIDEINSNKGYTQQSKDRVNLTNQMIKNGVEPEIVSALNDTTNNKTIDTLYKKALNGDTKGVQKIIDKYNIVGVDSLKTSKNIVKSVNKVNDNLGKIIPNISDNTYKVIDDLKLDRGRLSTKAKKEKYMKEIRGIYGNEVANKINKELRIEKKLSTMNENLRQGLVNENNLSDLKKELYSKGDNPNVTENLLNKYETMFPNETKTIQKKVNKYKTLEKDIKKIEYLDGQKVLTPKEQELMSNFHKQMGNMFVEEGIGTKEDAQSIGKYVYHKAIGDLESKELKKLNQEANKKGWNKLDPNNYHEMHRTIQGSIRDINDKAGKKLLEDNIVKLYIERNLNNANNMYGKNVMKGFMDSFGTKVALKPKGSGRKGVKLTGKDINNYIKDMISEAENSNEIFVVKSALKNDKKIDINKNLDVDFLFGKYDTLDPKFIKPKDLKKFKESDIYRVPRDHWNTQVNTVSRYLKEDTSTFIKIYDKLSNVFKTQALMGGRYTANNFFGNLFNSYTTAGSNILNPSIQTKAIKLMQGKDGKIGNYTNREIRLQAMLNGLDNTQVANELQSGSNVDKLNRLIKNNGKGNPWESFKGGIRKVNDSIETNAKYANIVSHLEDGKTLAEAIDLSQKALFDYSDLTDFEQKYVKRVIPFYTFMRKNMPLQLDNIINNGSKVYRMGKIPYESQEGLSDEERQNIPEYMQDYVALGNGKYINPSLPLQGAKELLDPKNVINSISPLIKTPLEIAQNKNWFLDKEITDKTGLEGAKDKALYGAKQNIPLLQQFENIGKAIGGDSKAYDRFANWTWFLDPTKKLDIEQSKSNNLKAYQEQLDRQYEKIKEDNPEIANKEEIEKLRYQIKVGSKKGLNMDKQRKRLEELLNSY